MEKFDFEPLGEFIAQTIRESILEVYKDDFQYVEKYLPLYTDKLAERSRFRSKTFEGIAQAMADQWG